MSKLNERTIANMVLCCKKFAASSPMGAKIYRTKIETARDAGGDHLDRTAGGCAKRAQRGQAADGVIAALDCKTIGRFKALWSEAGLVRKRH